MHVYGVASAQFTIPVFPYITSALITPALPLLPSAPFPYTPFFQPFGSRMDTRRASKPSNSTPLHLPGRPGLCSDPTSLPLQD